MNRDNTYIRWFDSLSLKDSSIVGGKNSSLGELRNLMSKTGIQVPDGFATTIEAYHNFIKSNELGKPIQKLLEAYKQGELSLAETGRSIRRLFNGTTFPAYLAEEIRAVYKELSHQYDAEEVDVAVRSSATVEGSKKASFAGQLESFLNILGEEDLLESCRKCYASLFTDRAIAYREKHGFAHDKVAISIGIQKMVRSDKAGAGVMFTVDTESGFPEMILINASWGLGINVVQGKVNPDQYAVFKPMMDKNNYVPIIEEKMGSKDKKTIYSTGDSRRIESVHTPIIEQHHNVLNHDEILTLARWGIAIEKHYKQPMNIEWAKDGISNEVFIVQARPETVQSRYDSKIFTSYKLNEEGKTILKGLSIGNAIASGRVYKIDKVDDLNYLTPGCIIVAEMTEPDWVPSLHKISGIITDYGGRTCHAAIVSRELGIPAIVGTGDATQILNNNQYVTISCAGGEQGLVFEGNLDYTENVIELDKVPSTKTEIMLNMADPDGAMKWWRLPVDGIGLARMEHIIERQIKIHPLALAQIDKIKDHRTHHEVLELSKGYTDKKEYFIDNLARGIAKIAASQYPRPVLIRMSDFLSDEYARLIGGQEFEPIEKNPLLGWRGASRYYSKNYREGFGMECRAVKKAREELGFDNIIILIPYCRTPEEAVNVLQTMNQFGLKRNENGLQVYMMCELPSNVILAEEFTRHFDGFMINTDSLSQMILGIDTDARELSFRYREQDKAVKYMINDFILRVHKAKCKVGIGGKVINEDPDYITFLIDSGIDFLSLNPDSIFEVIQRVSEAEKQNRIVSNV